MARTFSHVIAFDDAPFAREHRGDVLVVGVVCSGLRLDGVVTGRIRRDGVNSTRALADLVRGSRFGPQTQLLLLQGIALGGFNVVDIHRLHELLGVAVLVVARRQPDMAAIERALTTRVRGGRAKWRLIQRAGEMEACAGVRVQRAGLTLSEAEGVIRRLATIGTIPEPLRLAHLIAGGLGTGHSRGRA